MAGFALPKVHLNAKYLIILYLRTVGNKGLAFKKLEVANNSCSFDEP